MIVPKKYKKKKNESQNLENSQPLNKKSSLHIK